MKFVFDHYALRYMLEQFPRNIATELWELFITSCNDETIVSHREAQKLLEQEVVEQNSLDWIKNNSAIFKTTTTVESELLGTMMDEGVFEFLSPPPTDTAANARSYSLHTMYGKKTKSMFCLSKEYKY